MHFSQKTYTHIEIGILDDFLENFNLDFRKYLWQEKRMQGNL